MEDKQKNNAGRTAMIILILLIMIVPAYVFLDGGQSQTAQDNTNCDQFYNFRKEEPKDQALESYACLRQLQHWGFTSFETCEATNVIGLEAISGSEEYAPELAQNYTAAVLCTCCKKEKK